MPDTTVRLYQSTDAGAPALSGTAGAAIGVLNACLVDGYGSVTLTSLVVASDVATATYTAHGFTAFYSTYPVINISGATPAGLNGDFRIASITANTFTFATSGISDQTATGTIVAKRAAAGWTKPYTGTNLAAYRNDSVTGSGTYLRVDDTGTADIRVVGYETMSDVNTGTGPFPTGTQISGGGYIGKANNTSGSRAWVVVATKEMAYIFFAANASYPAAYGTLAFGDPTALKSGDAYRCVIAGLKTSTAATNNTNIFGDTPAVSSNYSPRSYTQLGPSVALSIRVPGGTTTVNFLSGNGPLTYPNGPDNGLLLYPNLRLDEGTHVRHVFPGAYVSPQNLATLATSISEVLNVPGLTGRALIAIPLYMNIGLGFIDITGPW